MSDSHDIRRDLSPGDDAWDVFELDDDVVAEPQPEYGDFWGVPDDDCDDGS